MSFRAFLFMSFLSSNVRSPLVKTLLVLTALFSAVVKLFVHRRSSESAPHRKVSLELAKIVAGIMKSNLDWIETTDLSSTLLYSKVMMKSISTLLFEGEFQNCTAQAARVLTSLAYQIVPKEDCKVFCSTLSTRPEDSTPTSTSTPKRSRSPLSRWPTWT